MAETSSTSSGKGGGPAEVGGGSSGPSAASTTGLGHGVANKGVTGASMSSTPNRGGPAVTGVPEISLRQGATSAEIPKSDSVEEGDPVDEVPTAEAVEVPTGTTRNVVIRYARGNTEGILKRLRDEYPEMEFKAVSEEPGRDTIYLVAKHSVDHQTLFKLRHTSAGR